MLSSFIYIVKGSRVIDRCDPVDWAAARWMPNEFAKRRSYSMADLKIFFAYRRSPYSTHRLDQWMAHKHRLTASTLFEAMTLADKIAKGLFEPIIDVDAIIKNGMAPDWVKRYSAG